MTHDDAFLLLQIFRRRALPTLLRKLQIWKGLHPDQHRDLVEDLEQELWLDCLQNTQLILDLPSRERHTRWFRLVERHHYRLHIRSERVRAPEASLDALTDPDVAQACESSPDPVCTWGRELPPNDQQFLRRLSASARYLKNGRINCRESAQRLGLRPHDLNRAWNRIAEGLGFDDEFLSFWRRRLIEALVGLAADLLRDRRLVSVHGERQRRRPDPLGRLRRLRQLRNHLSWRPVAADVKHILTGYHRRTSAADIDPREVLRDAASLDPLDPGIRLWEFEAHLAARDLPAAARALRAARRCEVDPVRERLARARLLEVRGRDRAAAHLLATSPAPLRRDPRLQRALRALPALPAHPALPASAARTNVRAS